jgi:hypothetical protein
VNKRSSNISCGISKSLDFFLLNEKKPQTFIIANIEERKILINFQVVIDKTITFVEVKTDGVLRENCENWIEVI